MHVVIRRTYVLMTARMGLLSPIPRLFCAKELYISAKEPYISAKESNIESDGSAAAEEVEEDGEED